ncbi:MAG: hypothetical protein IJC86_04385 [Clostridia bacterium]|nr:hypothetical protein [Clostridia bacterium]
MNDTPTYFFDLPDKEKELLLWFRLMSEEDKEKMFKEMLSSEQNTESEESDD